MLGRIQSAGSDIVSIGKTQLLCAQVHRLHKALDAAVQPYTGGIGSIVAGGQQHPARQRVQRNHVALHQSHRGAFHLDGIGIDQKIIVQIRLLEHHHRADDFGGACHRQPLVDVLPAQHPTGGCLHHQIGFCGGIGLFINRKILQRYRRRAERGAVFLGKNPPVRCAAKKQQGAEERKRQAFENVQGSQLLFVQKSGVEQYRICRGWRENSKCTICNLAL